MVSTSKEYAETIQCNQLARFDLIHCTLPMSPDRVSWTQSKFCEYSQLRSVISSPPPTIPFLANGRASAPRVAILTGLLYFRAAVSSSPMSGGSSKPNESVHNRGDHS